MAKVSSAQCFIFTIVVFSAVLMMAPNVVEAEICSKEFVGTGCTQKSCVTDCATMEIGSASCERGLCYCVRDC